MRVAAIYDIHGNLPALEAVLQEIRQVGADHVVLGGDVFPGPMPRETLARLLDLDISKQFIQGNGDREVRAPMQGIETGAVPEPYRALMRWNAQQLRPEDQRMIGAYSAAAYALRSHEGRRAHFATRSTRKRKILQRRTFYSRLPKARCSQLLRELN